MQPLKLYLKGFRGIRDGLGIEELTLDLERLADGAQLIAIAGANGSGKTTIMDNLHPYIFLPSRAAMAGPGGFTCYDHVYLPENIKDLTWALEGRSYRSQVVVRLGARRRTEAYLHRLDVDGQWRPMALEDGTVSDGRVETYSRCVEHLCGSPETFFTSVFAAQGKRQLSSYRNGEIKTLLADLLGQEEIRDIGRKAAETARLLKAGLGAMRQEQAGLAEEIAGVEAAKRRIEDAASRVGASQTAKQKAQAAVDATLEHHTRLRAAREHGGQRGQPVGNFMKERFVVTPVFEGIRSLFQCRNERLDPAVGAIRNQQNKNIAKGAKLQWIERRQWHFGHAFALADTDHEHRPVLAPETPGRIDIDRVEGDPAALGRFIPLDDRQPPRFDLGPQPIGEPVTQRIRRLGNRSLDGRIGHSLRIPSFVR